MRAPGFWGNPPDMPGWAARLLAPLGWLWSSITAWRMARPGVKLGIPVICVGNITVGGAGKTPAVIAIIERLRVAGRVAHVISRGHGGSLEGPLRVDPLQHRADEVGDEPLLLAAFAPVWIGKDRAATGRTAAAAGAKILVMDDGFQNPGLSKDLSLVVVDADFGFGNGGVIPAGPLREPVEAGLRRADQVLVIGPLASREAFRKNWAGVNALPVLDGELQPLVTGMDWRNLRCLAFAGIGRPAKFFKTLSNLGAEIQATRSFDDHEFYDPRLLARLEGEARSLGAQLVTTEKDAVRLPPAFRSKVLVVPVRLEIEDWTPFDQAIARL